MQTLKFDIISDNPEFILEKQRNYSFAFRKLYRNYSKLNDETFETILRTKYNLSSREWGYLKIDVKTKISQVQDQKSKIESDIISIEKEIKLVKVKPKTTKNIRLLFKLNRKLQNKNKSLSKDIIFGGKVLSQSLSKNIKYKEEYKNNRILPFNYLGSLNDLNSNRYFDFDFNNDLIIYKPNRNTRIELKYNISKKWKKILLKLDLIKNSEILPISIKLDRNYVCITFDDEKLNGYAFKKKEFYIDLNKLPKSDTIGRKELAVQFYNEQEERKLKNKLLNRYCSIDLNPEYIGVSIIDKIGENEIKVVDKFCYGLTDLIKTSKKSSSDAFSVYLNNKRKYEIGKIYSDLFKIVNHYHCGYFVMEDLNFKSSNVNENSNEFNRKTKNVWNLNLQQNLINKHCNTLGIIKIEVNPCYSSFIGNLTYNYFDPVNASIEIGRRGVFKFIKGNSFYPVLTGTMLYAMSKRFNSPRDVLVLKDCTSWKQIFAIFKETGLRYRFQLSEVVHRCFSKDNKKSGVFLYTF